ncbi:proline-rich protein HaeIII subfamily 1-like [Penaeus monodon]|uniref:proline-rich protein HaeIII subfamily 1-like n=1 Tax=Penaeus monodon TaxID=6687 RepID=UPI0018A724A6|nr:proline-rich protein HaeIII subfamily 1-like [Penaeus monodon]
MGRPNQPQTSSPQPRSGLPPPSKPGYAPTGEPQPGYASQAEPNQGDSVPKPKQKKLSPPPGRAANAQKKPGPEKTKTKNQTTKGSPPPVGNQG